MDDFKLDTVKGMVGDTLKITNEETGVEVTTSIEKVIEAPMNGDEWEAFSAIMHAEPESPSLSQGTYKISCDKLGEGRMFISPNSPTEYEIVVTRKKN
jgi:hypothetical protein